MKTIFAAILLTLGISSLAQQVQINLPDGYSLYAVDANGIPITDSSSLASGLNTLAPIYYSSVYPQFGSLYIAKTFADAYTIWDTGSSISPAFLIYTSDGGASLESISGGSAGFSYDGFLSQSGGVFQYSSLAYPQFNAVQTSPDPLQIGSNALAAFSLVAPILLSMLAFWVILRMAKRTV